MKKKKKKKNWRSFKDTKRKEKKKQIGKIPVHGRELDRGGEVEVDERWTRREEKEKK